MAMEPKMDIYNIVPPEFSPKTILIENGLDYMQAKSRFFEKGFSFPIIVKPNIGLKSYAVSKLYSFNELKKYINQTNFDFLIQEFVGYKNELGVFYVREPDNINGRITGLVAKEFLTVIGDGSSTVLELIKKDPRSHFQLKELQKRFGNKLRHVLKEGEDFVLVPLGSHTRGAKFIDITEKITPELTNIINQVCSKIDGFYYGRLDILYTTMEALSRGKDFSIIEVNGAGSEVTHIYDPRHSLFFGWKEIIRHWNYLCAISIANHKKGYPYLSYRDGRAMLKANNRMEAQLKLI